MTRSRRSRRGASAVEFALSLPILITVLMGVIALSSYISQLHAVTRAARDGARVGSVTLEGISATGDDIEYASEVQARAVLDSTGYLCGGDPSIDTDDNPDCVVTAKWYYDDPFYYVTVWVSYPLDVGNYPGFPDNVTSQFTMMTQQQ